MTDLGYNQREITYLTSDPLRFLVGRVGRKESRDRFPMGHQFLIQLGYGRNVQSTSLDRLNTRNHVED